MVCSYQYWILVNSHLFIENSTVQCSYYKPTSLVSSLLSESISKKKKKTILLLQFGFQQKYYTIKYYTILAYT